MPKMRRKADLPSKPCLQCGRPMAWRKAWARTWDAVLYCSDRCRADAKRSRQSSEEGAVAIPPDGPVEAKTSR
jgi:hypothetical protein